MGYRLLPGVTIALNRGDTWAESFKPLGNGTYDSATFDSVYASTLATQTALYTGDGTRAAYRAVLVSDGAADPDTPADHYVTLLARADASRAAHAAADAASTWVTLTSYGSGANAKIAPGGTIHAGISFNDSFFSGGWKIKDIDIDTAYIAGIVYDLGIGTPHANGLWIENVNISNITGMPVRVSGFPYPGLIAPYQCFCAAGIDTCGINYLRLKDVNIDHCDMSMLHFGTRYLYISGGHWHHMYIQGAIFGGYPGAAYATSEAGSTFYHLIENVETDNVAYAATPAGAGPGFYKGEASMQSANMVNGVYLGLNIHDTILRHSDANAFDNEGQTAAGIPPVYLIQGCNFHDNNGTPFLQNGQLTESAACVIIDGNTFTRNANTNYINPAVLGNRTVSTDPWYFTRNDIALGTAVQPLFGGDATNVYSPKYNTPQTGKLFGSSNTVHFP